MVFIYKMSETNENKEDYLTTRDRHDSSNSKHLRMNLNNIRFGIDAEIDKALSLFCKDENRLSKIYWPKAFRNLVTSVLVSILDKPHIWAELSTPACTVNEEQIQAFIKELRLPTSVYIKVKQRQWVVHLLREMAFCRRKFKLRAGLPGFVGESENWPNDLEDKDDLFNTITDKSLRKDINDYIWKVLDDVIPVGKYCNLHYFGDIRLTSKRRPILIEVTEDYVDILSERISTLSSKLRVDYDSLIPDDLIEIKGIPAREVVVGEVEGFSVSGSPWKEGTIGGIMKYGQRLIGITSGHVHRKSMASFDSFCIDEDPPSRRFVDNKVDVAFFTISGNTEDWFNLIPLSYVGAAEDLALQVGEPVYKIGRSTGLTVGTLGSLHSTFRAAGGFRYEDHVQVIWNEDGRRFAFNMDCGSLYCVRRGSVYVPIAIHRISDDGETPAVSYGCSIWKAMELFPEDSEDT